jgi:2-(1,2-epoxy-1,2-dihydrophenyl)acetyl-CoA isomerase
MFTEYETILFRKKNLIATISLNRPEFLNALNVTMCNELLDVLKKCGLDEEIGAVILTGVGKAFCAGGDVRDMRDFLREHPLKNPGKIIEEIVSVFNPVLLTLREIKKPVIGAINGFCSGGGAGLAQACDILFASESAKIHVPNINIGLVPDGGNTLLLTQKLGRHKAAELMFTGDPLDAREAHKLGLFNRVVPEENLVSEAEKFAERLARGPRFAIGLAKNLLNKAVSGNLKKQLELEKEGVITCAGTREFKEGITAFFEKRKPDFNNL